MKFRLVIIAALGLALALYLVMYVGLSAVFAAAMSVGWGGFAILCLYALVLFPLLGAAWYVLLPDHRAAALYARSYGREWCAKQPRMCCRFPSLAESCSARARQSYTGVSRPLAFASMIVDVTTEMLAQIPYVALGLAILSARAPRTFCGRLAHQNVR